MRSSRKHLLTTVAATTVLALTSACAPSSDGASNGEVDGIEINVRNGDDGGDPDKAVQLAKQYIGDGVSILTGTVSSGVALSVGEQAAQNKVLYISGAAAADPITGLNEYTFRSGRQSLQDVATAGTFLDDIEGKKVLVFAQDNAFGQGNAAAVDALLGENGQGAEVDPLLVAEDIKEFTSFAQQILDRKPDLVFVAWAGDSRAAGDGVGGPGGAAGEQLSDGSGADQPMTSTPAALVVDEVSLQIGGARILEDVNLQVPAGSFIGVIGPNGAGKTTLFNIVSGVLRPTSGSVRLDGRDITGLSIHRRARAGVGRTFQTSNLFPGLSVLENVRLAAQVGLGGSMSLFRFPHRGDTATSAALEGLERVGLTDRLDVPAGQLSHGDKRKLEIAVLLATEPEVVLLDEPMAGVGSGDVAGLSEIIRAMHREKKCTILMVEHHMEVLLGLVDRVAVMHRGSILAFDTPAVVMADPVVQGAYLGATA